MTEPATEPATNPAATPAADPFGALRAATRARVALGRVGDALPTVELLALRAAQAAARDAVHAPLDSADLERQLRELGREVRVVASAAPDRAGYLQRPDLGRRLADGTELSPEPGPDPDTGGYDLAVVIADGLSPLAVQHHATPLLAAVLERLDEHTGPRLAPVVIATQARVAIGDEIAVGIGAHSVLVLIGERPGMSSTDSLGAYFTYGARPGRRDSERNCVSNIRPPHGTGYDAAAATLVLLMAEANRLKLSGVGLKADPALPG